MKKLLYILICLPLIFSSCEKNENTPVAINGCTDSAACNYDASANTDDGSCLTDYGCTDPLATNYDASATCDDGTCVYPAVDIRAQMVGNYTGTAVITTTDIFNGNTTTDAGQVPVVCELYGTTNVHITIGEDGVYVTLNCNVITEVAGGLTFQIIETDGVTFPDCDGNLSNYFILNGEDDPQTYTAASNTLDFSFAMENGSCMYEFSIIAVK